MHLSRAFRHAGSFTATLLLLSGILAGVPVGASLAAAPVTSTGKPVALEGELDVLVEDYADGRSVTRHFLKTTHGRVELKFGRKPTTLLSGTRVRVRGQLAGGTLALDDGSSANVEVVQAALPYTMGEQRTAVIMVNFQDDTSQPVTSSAAHSLVFTTVSNFYQEASFQQTWLAGQTFGWYTIPVSKSVCDTGAIYTEADKAVAASGADLSGYGRKIYMFPRNACGWTGLANVGGSVTRAWINGSFTLQAVGHELGHNQGLSHAHSRDCGSVTLGGTCTVSDYGDVADIMGAVRVGHFSPFQKELMGWLNDGVSPPIHTASTSGRYSIEPYSSSSVGPKAIKIPRGTDTSGRTLWYYVEYRQPIGADASMGTVGNLTKGVLVRLATEGDRYSSDLLDTTPASYSGSTGDFQDGALATGQSYNDAGAGVTITLASADTTGATVDVTFSGSTPPPTCTRAAPTLSISGSTAAVAAGSTVSYTVSLSNKDSSACAATTFNLAKSIPSGWTGTLAGSTLSLSPGASGSTTLSVTSPSTATAAGYGIGVGSSSAVGNAHTANASATYTVASSGTLSETVGTNKTSYLRAETVSMSALVKNNDVPVSGASVKFTVTLPSGSTTVISATSGSDGYARGTYKTGKGKGAIGSYTLRADATSGSSTATASTGFSVQ